MSHTPENNASERKVAWTTQLRPVDDEGDNQHFVGFLKIVLGATTSVHVPDGMRDFLCNLQPLADDLDSTSACIESFEFIFGPSGFMRDADILLRQHLRDLPRNEHLNGQLELEPLIGFPSCWR